MSAFDGPTPEQIAEEETNRQQRLDRARRILAVYYILMPFVLIYLLFKIFPPHPWPPEAGWVQMVFLINKFNIWTTVEERLLLLVIVSGALGSYIHSATSYSDYRGNRQFGPSWLLWYLLRPLVGVCLALVVYFAIRGGLLSMVITGASAGDAKNLSPFGIAAIAGLTGMFSKQAADKLAEVFTTLFKSQGDQYRRDSLTLAPAPEIKKVDPDRGAPGTKVTITGAAFAAGVKVSFGDDAAANVTFVNETTITAEAPAGAGVVDVIVVNSDGQKATASKAFTYLPSGEETNSAGAAVDGEAGDVDDISGCDVEMSDSTADEDLPITQGGVA